MTLTLEGKIKPTPSRYSVPDNELTVHLFDDRRCTISPWCKGNSKLGPNVYTYSKLPLDTCPGSSFKCREVCYARKIEQGSPTVWDLWKKNTNNRLPMSLPESAEVVRIHVSGDFNTIPYIIQWWDLVNENPDVLFFGYTRSWIIPDLLPHLQRLNQLPNVTIFASMDESMPDLPSDDFRVAWIGGDPRLKERAEHSLESPSGVPVLICPEGTGRTKNCEECGYCFKPTAQGDVMFLEH